jgi:hypothetical protein
LLGIDPSSLRPVSNITILVTGAFLHADVADWVRRRMKVADVFTYVHAAVDLRT